MWWEGLFWGFWEGRGKGRGGGLMLALVVLLLFSDELGPVWNVWVSGSSAVGIVICRYSSRIRGSYSMTMRVELPECSRHVTHVLIYNFTDYGSGGESIGERRKEKKFRTATLHKPIHTTLQAYSFPLPNQHQRIPHLDDIPRPHQQLFHPFSLQGLICPHRNFQLHRFEDCDHAVRSDRFAFCGDDFPDVGV